MSDSRNKFDKKTESDSSWLPTLPTLPRVNVSFPPHFFFARNPAEYNQRRELVRVINDDFTNYQRYINLLTNQAKSLKQIAASRHSKDRLLQDIELQLLKVNQYKGLLEDLHRRHRGINDFHGLMREINFRELPELSEDTTREEQINQINARLAQLDEIMENLNAAKSRVSGEKSQQQKLVYYSKLDVGQTFNGGNPSANLAQARQAAKLFLQSRESSEIDSLSLATGKLKRRTESDFHCRMIGTEVLIKPGKSAAVAIVQELTEDKSYCRQDIITTTGKMHELDKLPLSAKAKMAKIEEQMKFVSHTVETALAAIKTNGPINLENWPKNLARAAAVYCHKMGYELTPAVISNNIKPAELSTLLHAFQQQINNDPELKKHIDEALDRSNLKAPRGRRPAS